MVTLVLTVFAALWKKEPKKKIITSNSIFHNLSVDITFVEDPLKLMHMPHFFLVDIHKGLEWPKDFTLSTREIPIYIYFLHVWQSPVQIVLTACENQLPSCWKPEACSQIVNGRHYCYLTWVMAVFNVLYDMLIIFT